MTKVDNWAKEWFLIGEINQAVVDFVCNVQANLLTIMVSSKLTNQGRNSELLRQAHALQFLIFLLSRKDFWDHFHVPKNPFS